MILRAIFGHDLSGKLRRWKSKYSNLNKSPFWNYIFDEKNIYCYLIPGLNGLVYKISARAYCNDLEVASYYTSYLAHFYEARFLSSAHRAKKRFDQEILKASKEHPESRFYRGKNSVGKNGLKYEFCQDGKWFDCKKWPSLKRCEDCGTPIEKEDKLCSGCGKYILNK